MRLTFGAAAAVAVGVLGALLLGEYEFTGLDVLAAAVLFGLFIGEAAVAAAGTASNRRLGLLAAAVGVAGMTWGAWISTGRDLSFLGLTGWVAIPLAGVAAGVRTGLRPVLRKDRSPGGAGSLPEGPARGASPGEHPA